MTQEQKDLLLQDLCGRLPYGVKVSYYGSSEECECVDVVEGIYSNGEVVVGKYGLPVESVKPYLFPLSSMTKEQESYLHFNTKFRTDRFGDLVVKIDEDDNYFYTDIFDYVSIIDWLNKNHFDYRGLILMGLANDATGLNIY